MKSSKIVKRKGWFYYVRSKSPFACLVGNSEEEVRQRAVNALRFYRKTRDGRKI